MFCCRHGSFDDTEDLDVLQALACMRDFGLLEEPRS
jgi:hypothetical protein